MTDYVFGYASLVELRQTQIVGGVERVPVPGRLRGYRRCWGAAMNNWEGGDTVKHYLDPETGERPRIRVAYLDIYEQAGGAVNGLALPVDADRLAALDAREINYERIDVSAAFEPMPAEGESASSEERSPRVFTYLGLGAARERCRRGVAEGNAFAAADYASAVRRAFERLAPDALAEFDRTTDPLPFPQRDLSVVLPLEGA